MSRAPTSPPEGCCGDAAYVEIRTRVTNLEGIPDGSDPGPGRSRKLALTRGHAEDLSCPLALTAYRSRLLDLDTNIDRAAQDSDLGRVEHLSGEREQILAEIRRATGLGGRPRAWANDPAERARKSVSARIRDTIKHLERLAPDLAAHLDRSIQTGLRCTYDPAPDDPVDWLIRDLTPDSSR